MNPQELHNNIERSLGRIEGKLDSITEWQKEHESQDSVRFESVLTKVTTISDKQMFNKGAMAVIVFIIGFIPALILKWWSK